MNKKITELNEAGEINEYDLLMIVQNNENKKINKKNLLKNIISYKYIVKTTEEIQENTDYEIPCYYKVGEDVLDVYYMGEKLVKDEHYKEVGSTGAKSNKIQFYNWGQDVPIGRDIEFIVKGTYE